MKIEILDEAEADLIEGYHHVDSEPLRKTVNVTGFHRKHAIRVLAKMMTSPETPKPPPRSRLYDEAVEAALNLRHAVDRLANDQD